MDFSLSEEQLLLKDSITTFVDKDYLFDVRQKNIKTELGYSSDFWKTFADLGWLGTVSYTHLTLPTRLLV